MSGSLDTLKANLTALVRSVMHPVDYFALYAAKVVKQDAGTLLLELQPDDTRIPGMQRVPIRLGIPNTTAKVVVGARGLVGFENGDPSKPFWGPWGTSELELLTIGGPSGAQFVALSNKVDDGFASVRSAFNDHTHPLDLVTGTTSNAIVGSPSAIVPGGLIGPTSKPSAMAAIASTAATKVKVL